MRSADVRALKGLKQLVDSVLVRSSRLLLWGVGCSLRSHPTPHSFDARRWPVARPVKPGLTREGTTPLRATKLWGVLRGADVVSPGPTPHRAATEGRGFTFSPFLLTNGCARDPVVRF